MCAYFGIVRGAFVLAMPPYMKVSFPVCMYVYMCACVYFMHMHVRIFWYCSWGFRVGDAPVYEGVVSCMYACIYVCMCACALRREYGYLCLLVSHAACMCVFMYIRMCFCRSLWRVCVYVRTHVCMLIL